MVTGRPPVFAGRFYPGDARSCAAAADELLRVPSLAAAPGGIVPHAGWVYSGPTAALTIRAVAGGDPDTVVIFGAEHVRTDTPGSVFAHGVWRTPLGNVKIDEELASRFLRCTHIKDAPDDHAYEHSIEVQLPLLQRLLPDLRIVPIMVRSGPDATEIGRYCGAEGAAAGKTVAFIGSTDLTHYGPAFGFEPHGRGVLGIRWAKEVNDRRLISLIEALDAEAIVAEAAINHNACGAGAVAATVAAMREIGAGRYVELRHTCSAEVEVDERGEVLNSVGYEAGVFQFPS